VHIEGRPAVAYDPQGCVVVLIAEESCCTVDVAGSCLALQRRRTRLNSTTCAHLTRSGCVFEASVALTHFELAGSILVVRGGRQNGGVDRDEVLSRWQILVVNGQREPACAAGRVRRLAGLIVRNVTSLMPTILRCRNRCSQPASTSLVASLRRPSALTRSTFSQVSSSAYINLRSLMPLLLCRQRRRHCAHR
jgi:hypothetical protein